MGVHTSLSFIVSRGHVITSAAVIAGIGLLIGARHAFEPDHLAAVSTLATRRDDLARALTLAATWGVGHSAAAGVVALVVIVLGIQLSPAFASLTELFVAALLILLGLPILVRYVRGRWHMHVHEHDGRRHLHLHSHAETASHAHGHPTWDLTRAGGLGLAHGIAGSGALVALLVASAPTAGERWLLFGGFAAGSIAGMIAVSAAVAAGVRMASKRGAAWATALHVGAAVGSVVAGVMLALRATGP